MKSNDFFYYISKLAIKSMLYEVSTTPKPGLVDRANPGAHNDMDFFTFIDSSTELFSYFILCTKAGFDFNEENYTNLLKKLRPLGVDAENRMFKATNEVNTHKGLIFSLGIIAAAAGKLFKDKNEKYIKANELTNLVKEIASGITSELNNIDNKQNLTYGEKLYKKYGVKGIRGEVESGFETVVEYSLPLLRDLMKENRHINDILVQLLLNLIVKTEDSNILGRHDLEVLDYAKSKAEKALSHGGYFTTEGRLYVDDMDKYFIKKNISPGGSADLLAVTLMLYFVENGDNFYEK